MKVENIYWTDSRLAAQRVNTSALTAHGIGAIHTNITSLPFPAITERHTASRRIGFISSWAVFTMVIFAFVGLCLAVNRRANAELSNANRQVDQMRSAVDTLRNANATIENEVNRLRTDPRAIEAAARKRLNMARPDEVVFAIDAIE